MNLEQKEAWESLLKHRLKGHEGVWAQWVQRPGTDSFVAVDRNGNLLKGTEITGKEWCQTGCLIPDSWHLLTNTGLA